MYRKRTGSTVTGPRRPRRTRLEEDATDIAREGFFYWRTIIVLQQQQQLLFSQCVVALERRTPLDHTKSRGGEFALNSDSRKKSFFLAVLFSFPFLFFLPPLVRKCFAILTVSKRGKRKCKINHFFLPCCYLSCSNVRLIKNFASFFLWEMCCCPPRII